MWEGEVLKALLLRHRSDIVSVTLGNWIKTYHGVARSGDGLVNVAWVVLHCNRRIGARERIQLIPHIRFRVPFLGPESQLKSGFACAGLLCKAPKLSHRSSCIKDPFWEGLGRASGVFSRAWRRLPGLDTPWRWLQGIQAWRWPVWRASRASRKCVNDICPNN